MHVYMCLCVCNNLVQTLTLQQHSPHIITATSSLPTLSPAPLSTKPLPLVHAHFSAEKVAALLGEVCRLLGCRGDLTVLVDYLLDQCHAHSQLCCEYFLLLSYVLQGGGHKGCGHRDSIVSDGELIIVIEGVISRLVSPGFWSLSHDSTTKPAVSLNSELYNFLLVYVIYTCVHVLKENFDPLLQQSVYPLMQKLGSMDVGVANATMATLQAVCLHCGYE